MISVKDSVAAGGSRCKLRRCKKCHSARKAVRKWYANANRTSEWDTMSAEKKREVIVANKEKGSGRGHKQEVHVIDRVECNDKVSLQQDKPFLTQKQFLGESEMSHVVIL